MRRALKLFKKNQRIQPADEIDRVVELAAQDDDPELAALKQGYRQEFRDAFHGVIAGMKLEERRLLRYHYVENLNTRQISKLLGVNQSTIVRWLTKVRGQILIETRKALLSQMGLQTADFRSMMRLVQSQVDLSIERVLSTQVSDGKKID